MVVTPLALKDTPYQVPDEDAFDVVDEGRPTERKLAYLEAEELAKLAGDIIEAYGPRFKHLEGAAIAYRWKREGGKQAGKLCRGKVRRAQELERDELGYDFVLWLAADHLAMLEFTHHQVEAQLFSLLSRLDRHEKTGHWRMQHPEVELFVAEIEEYGIWLPNIKRVADAVRQLKLWGSEAA